MSILATEAELEIHLQRPIATDVAALALAGASAVVRGYCGWDLLREDVTFMLDGTGTLVLPLPTLLLIDVAEIRVDGVAIASTLAFQPKWTRRGQIFWAEGWEADCKVEVDCTHGYDDVPDLVRLVALTVAARIVDNPTDVKAASAGSVSRTYDSSLSALELRLLGPYRL
jgi:hypothetical protein